MLPQCSATWVQGFRDASWDVCRLWVTFGFTCLGWIAHSKLGKCPPCQNSRRDLRSVRSLPLFLMGQVQMGWAVDDSPPGVIQSWDWFFFYSFAREGKAEKGRGLTAASDITVPGHRAYYNSWAPYYYRCLRNFLFSLGTIGNSVLHGNTYNFVSTLYTLFHLIQFI